MANIVDLDFSFFGYSPLPKQTRSRLNGNKDTMESRLKLRQQTPVQYSTFKHAESKNSSCVQSTSGNYREICEENATSYTCQLQDLHIGEDDKLSCAAQKDIEIADNMTEMSVPIISCRELFHSKATSSLLQGVSVIVVSDSDCSSSSLLSSEKKEIKQTSSGNFKKFTTPNIIIPETDSSDASGRSGSPVATKSVELRDTQSTGVISGIVLNEIDSCESNGSLYKNKALVNSGPKEKSKRNIYRNRKVILSSTSSASSRSERILRNRKNNNINRKLIIPSSDSSFSEDNCDTNQVVLETIVIESSDEEDDKVPVSNHMVSRKPPTRKDVDNDDILGNAKNLCSLTRSKYQDIETWLDQNVMCNDKNSRTSAQMSPFSLETGLSIEPSLIADAENNVQLASAATSSCVPVATSVEKFLDELYGTTWHSAKKTACKSASSSESEDDFDKLMKKYVDGTRPSVFATERLQDAQTSTPDFINDEDISINSVGFYQALLNTDCKPHTKTDPAAGCVLTSVRRLSFLHLGSDEDDNVDQPLNNIDRPFLPPSDPNIVGKPKKKQNKKEALPVGKATTSSQVFKQPAVLTNSTKSNVKLTARKGDLPLRSFLESLSALTPAPYSDPEALDFKKNFSKKKNELCTALFTMYNKNIFDNKLPSNMRIEWNAHMRRTAGFCYNRREPGPLKDKIRSSRIELSTKVIDTADRLRDTLVHELCHAAVWIINGVQNGHGQFWKAWASKAMRCYPELPAISRCHEYEIETKYTYKCTCCGYSIGRHSKSLDVLKKRCGYCYGTFELLINYKSRGGQASTATPKTPRNPTAFALYVKENYSSVKSTRAGLKHGEVMKLLGQQFAATKVT